MTRATAPVITTCLDLRGRLSPIRPRHTPLTAGGGAHHAPADDRRRPRDVAGSGPPNPARLPPPRSADTELSLQDYASALTARRTGHRGFGHGLRPPRFCHWPGSPPMFFCPPVFIPSTLMSSYFRSSVGLPVNLLGIWPNTDLFHRLDSLCSD